MDTARTLFPDGIPAWISNAELERTVGCFVSNRIEDQVDYRPMVEFEGCGAPAATLENFRKLAEAVVENRNTIKFDMLDARSLEELVPSISEDGTVRFCR